MNSENNTDALPMASTQSETIHNWQAPIPLKPLLEQEAPYPLDAIPPIIQKAVFHYQHYGQQPLSMVACGALANMSLACQSLANVARDAYLTSPVSLYFLMVARSGERKTAADNALSKACRLWETEIRQKREPSVQEALVLHQAWQMEKDGLLLQIKRSMTTGLDSDFYKDLLERLVHVEPEIPLMPTLYFEDATQEALAIHLAHGWPSASLWSDEAGIVLGSHSMQSNPMRFVALLNRLWDGKAFTAHRKTSQSFTLKNRRLTVNLMMQPLLMDQMRAQGNNINRQSGFLARCLIAYPQSCMGKRFYQEPPKDLDFLTPYEDRLTACLTQSNALNRNGCADIPLLRLSAPAKHQWTLFFNSIEAGLSPNGEWLEVNDFASKASEQTARLAALFHLFEGRSGDISAECMERAIQIIRWHLYEARRLFATSLPSKGIDEAINLKNWLIEKGIHTITSRDILRLGPLRDQKQRDEALALLIEHQVIRTSKTGSKIIVELNPACF